MTYRTVNILGLSAMDLTHTQEEREAEGDFRIFTLGRKMGLHKSMLGYAKGLYGYYLWVGREVL